jgi:phage-related protein
MRTWKRLGLPRTEVYFYRDTDGSLPLLEWLDELPAKAQLKCSARISRLAEMGNELRRPEADYLRDGVYEVRASCQGVHYRILYFFSGRAVVVLSHGITKERVVPAKEIERAVQRKRQVESDFERYTLQP